MKDLNIFASGTFRFRRSFDDGRLTTAGFVQKSHLTDELLQIFFEFNRVDFLDICLGEAKFSLKTGNGLSLSSITFGSSIPSEPPLSDHWISHSKDPLSSHIDSRLYKNFQILAATWILEDFTIEDTLGKVPGLNYAQSVAGSNLLQCLEKTLSSSSLSKLDVDSLTGLMTILLVTLSVVIFSTSRFYSSLVSLLR